MAKLTDNETMAALQQRFASAYADYEQLQVVRQKALDYYYGRPLGNEIEGRAQVVCKDLMDAVEWTMPSLMRIFTTQQAVQFDPVGPEDIEKAKQETMYTNHVLWKKNDGFMTMYNWLKDGLYQKVGYIAYWWEEEEKTCYESYTGLTQDQLAMTIQTLEQRGEVEVTGAEASHTAPGMPQTWDIEVKITTTQGRAKVEAVPPDECVVSGDCRGSIKKAKFAGRIRKITRSELLEMGYSRKDVEALTDFTWANTGTAIARDPQGQAEEPDDGVGWATKELQLLDCFTYLDVDDDGYAELRHFIAGGNEFLEKETAEEIQLCSWTPIPTPHKHAGIDFFDLTEDFQRINTALTRGLLDNTYFSQNVRTAYDKNTVNVTMLQVNRPGGHVAVDGPPMNAIMPIVQPTDIGMKLLPVIQHFNMARDERTGSGSMTRGSDADVLAQSTKGAYLEAKGAANQRIESVARIFAETGLTDLYSSLHRLLRKHQDWPTRFALREDWVTVNPAEWDERTDLTVSVGLGTAGKEEIRQNLLLMGQTLQTLAQVPGLIQPANAYAYGKRLQTELGFESEPFITNPESQEYQQWQQSQQPPEDPYVAGAKIKAEADKQKAQLDATNKAADRAQERDLTITELEVKSGIDLAKAGIGAEVALARGNRPPGAGGFGANAKPAAAGSPVGA
jgi:hypothetical protein